MTKPISMAEHTGDACMWSPKQMLEDAVADCDGDRERYRKAVVLWLDDSDGRFDVGYTQAGMNCSQMIALVEVAKTMFLEDMGYVRTE